MDGKNKKIGRKRARSAHMKLFCAVSESAILKSFYFDCSPRIISFFFTVSLSFSLFSSHPSEDFFIADQFRVHSPPLNPPLLHTWNLPA